MAFHDRERGRGQGRGGLGGRGRGGGPRGVALPFSERVGLPASLRVGDVVGRGASNLRWLNKSSGGAMFEVDEDGVWIRAASPDVLARGLELLLHQFDSIARLGAPAYPKPLTVDYILRQDPFGPEPLIVQFGQRTDEVADMGGRPDSVFYELAPRAAAEGGSNGGGGSSSGGGGGSSSGGGGGRGCAAAAVDAVAGRLGGMHLCGGGGGGGGAGGDGGGGGNVNGEPRAFHAESSPATLRDVSANMTAAARAAAAHHPRFDNLKMRFTLGKNLFSNPGRRLNGAVRLHELEGVSASHRTAYNSFFSNTVRDDDGARLLAALTSSSSSQQQRGSSDSGGGGGGGPFMFRSFRLVDTKSRASAHVVNQEINVRYSIAMDVPYRMMPPELMMVTDGGGGLPGGGGGGAAAAASTSGGAAAITLRKFKAGGAKCHFTAVLGAPREVDLRLKLLAQYREHQGLVADADAHETAAHVVEAVTRLGLPRVLLATTAGTTGGGGGGGRGSGAAGGGRGRGYGGGEATPPQQQAALAALAALLPRDRKVEHVRIKSKRVYEGVLQLPPPPPPNSTTGSGGGGHGGGQQQQGPQQQQQRVTVRLSVLRVLDSNGMRTEVTGSLPDVDVALCAFAEREREGKREGKREGYAYDDNEEEEEERRGGCGVGQGQQQHPTAANWPERALSAVLALASLFNRSLQQ